MTSISDASDTLALFGFAKVVSSLGIQWILHLLTPCQFVGAPV